MFKRRNLKKEIRIAEKNTPLNLAQLFSKIKGKIGIQNYVVLKLITIVTALFRKETCLLYTYTVRFFLFLYLIKAVLCFMVLKIGYAVGNFFFKWKGCLSQYFSQTRFLQKSSKVSRDQ